MSSAGISLSSVGDLAISARGLVTIDGSAGVSITSSGDVTTEGRNVQLTAQAALTATSVGPAELSSGDRLTLQGVMVMIN
jgi:hypothetical protein